MIQNLIEIFRIGELLPQKRFPINSDNRKLRNASNHIYRHIVKLFVGFLSHVLSTLIRRIVLNAQGIRSFIYSMDNMRAIRIHHEPCFLRERDGLSTDRACIKSSSLLKQIRALFSRIFTHLHARRFQSHILHAHAGWVQRNRQGNQRCSMKLLGSKTPNKVWNRGISKMQSRRQKPNRVVIPS